MIGVVMHPAIAHDLELLIAGWLLVVVVFLIAWGVGLIRTEVRDLPAEGRHVRRTPEPTRVVLHGLDERP